MRPAVLLSVQGRSTARVTVVHPTIDMQLHTIVTAVSVIHAARSLSTVGKVRRFVKGVTAFTTITRTCPLLRQCVGYAPSHQVPRSSGCKPSECVATDRSLYLGTVIGIYAVPPVHVSSRDARLMHGRMFRGHLRIVHPIGTSEND